MWRLLLSGVGAVFFVGFAIGAAVRHFAEYPQEYGQRRRQRVQQEPDVSRITLLGPCSHCDAEVNTLDGCSLSCNHFIHYTCQHVMKQELGKYANFQTLCKICMTTRMKHPAGPSTELANRTRNSEECVICRSVLGEDDSRTLTCSHRVHEKCWSRIEETSTTCPACMNDI